MSDEVNAWQTAPHRVAVGRLGEQAAWELLQAKGYSLVHQNWRSGRFEIDLIVRDPDHVLVFVEVKANRGTGFGPSAARVHGRKQLRVQRAAQAYVLQQGLQNEDMRFDVVGVESTAQGLILTHYPNAFLPSNLGYFGM